MASHFLGGQGGLRSLSFSLGTILAQGQVGPFTLLLKLGGVLVGAFGAVDGLLQDWSTLDTWVGLVDAATWGGLEAGLVRAVTRQLGDAELESLPVLGVIPTDVFEAALGDANRGGRRLFDGESPVVVGAERNSSQVWGTLVVCSSFFPRTEDTCQRRSGCRFKWDEAQAKDESDH